MSDDEKKTAYELRVEFLKDANTAMEKLHGAIIAENGVGTLSDSQMKALQMYWPTLDKMMTAVNDREKRDVENVSQVLTLLKEGTISVAEAKEFMLLFKMGEEVKAIIKGDRSPLEGEGIGGLTIIVQTQDKTPAKQQPPIEGDKDE